MWDYVKGDKFNMEILDYMPYDDTICPKCGEETQPSLEDYDRMECPICHKVYIMDSKGAEKWFKHASNVFEKMCGGVIHSIIELKIDQMTDEKEKRFYELVEIKEKAYRLYYGYFYNCLKKPENKAVLEKMKEAHAASLWYIGKGYLALGDIHIAKQYYAKCLIYLPKTSMVYQKFSDDMHVCFPDISIKKTSYLDAKVWILLITLGLVVVYILSR